MANLDTRIARLESRINRETPPEIVFWVAGTFDPNKTPHGQHNVIFEVIQPDTVPTQPK